MFVRNQPKVMVGGWRNQVAARLMLYYKLYHPLGSVDDGTKLGPVLLVLGLDGACTPAQQHGRH